MARDERLRLGVRRLICGLAVVLALAGGTLATAEARSGPVRCAGQRLALLFAPGGQSPYVRLDADDKGGAFLLDTGATASTVSAGAFGPGAVGSAVVVKRFTLPSFPNATFRLAQYGLVRQPAGGQLGIIGTDFLSLLTADFRFAGASGDVVLASAPCNSAALRASGLVPVRQSGFFSSDPKRIVAGRANVPVLFLRIAGVQTWAQIDTGYDDSQFKPSIDINAALLAQLTAEGVPLAPVGDSTVTTCAGREMRRVYRVTGRTVTVETDKGQAVRTLESPHLIVKGGNSCGGIGSMAAPAAQVGMSTLLQLGRVVFDPKSELVWLTTQPSDRTRKPPSSQPTGRQ